MSRDSRQPPGGLRDCLRVVGPGIAMAATGVGAGDVVAGAVTGAKYGYAVIWAVIAGAALKLILNEGLARWQLATGTTLFEGWVLRLGRWVQWLFLAYLLFWSFVVAGALMSACGLAAHALFPGLSVKAWAVVHSLGAAALVAVGGYERFELAAKVLVGLMFVTLVGAACLVGSPVDLFWRSLTEAAVPPGGAPYVLSVIGGVGGSVTLLAYGYWIREKGWQGAAWLPTVRVDLVVAYALTGLFGAAVVVLAAAVLHPRGIPVEGQQGVLRMSEMLSAVAGPTAGRIFVLGFWGAVATSILGVWQGDPYLFCDFVALLRGVSDEERERLVKPTSLWYRAYLLWLAIPPMLLLRFEKPVLVIVIYAITGALFMPFLAATLLYMNSRREWVGELRNPWWVSLLLALTLALFVYLVGAEVTEQLGRLAGG